MNHLALDSRSKYIVAWGIRPVNYGGYFAWAKAVVGLKDLDNLSLLPHGDACQDSVS